MYKELATTTTTTTTAIPAEYMGFTEAEALGGMDQIQQGYFQSYKYTLTRPTIKSNFQIKNSQTDEIVWTGSEIKNAVIYYGHEVMRLKDGYISAPGKDEANFTDDENKFVAQTYDPKNSRGNFDANGLGEYLGREHEGLHKRMIRLYLFMILPEEIYCTGTDVVAASFSATTVMSFKALRTSFTAEGLFPLPFIKCSIGFEGAKSLVGKEYDRVVFRMQKKDDLPHFSFKSREMYLTNAYGLPLLEKIIDTHNGAIESTESISFGGKELVVSHRDVLSAATSITADGVKETFKGTEVEDEATKLLFS